MKNNICDVVNLCAFNENSGKFDMLFCCKHPISFLLSYLLKPLCECFNEKMLKVKSLLNIDETWSRVKGDGTKLYGLEVRNDLAHVFRKKMNRNKECSTYAIDVFGDLKSDFEC